MSATHLSGLLVKPRTLTSATTLTETDAGKTIFLNSATGFTTTLPAPKAGLSFTFVVKTAPTPQSHIIKAASSADIIRGQVYTVDVNSGTDPDFETSGNNTLHFVGQKAVVGDKAVLVSDGTYWYASGYCSVYDAMTFLADSSLSPSISPSKSPSLSPSYSPSISPSYSPSISPSISSSYSPSISPSKSPSISPSLSPSLSPSISPS